MLMMPIKPKVIARPSAASKSTLPRLTPLNNVPSDLRHEKAPLDGAQRLGRLRAHAGVGLDKTAVGIFLQQRAEDLFRLGIIAAAQVVSPPSRRSAASPLLISISARAWLSKRFDFVVGFFLESGFDQRQHLVAGIVGHRPRRGQTLVAIGRNQLERRDGAVESARECGY